MLQDLRLAFRQIWKTPGFTAVVVLTLALGIGATTAIFSLLNAVLLRSLPFPDADRIVTIWSYNTARPLTDRRNSYTVSRPDFRDWQAQSRSFEALTRYTPRGRGVVFGGVAEAAAIATVSDQFFPTLGVLPRAGRLFSAEEHRVGGVAVISEGLARRHLPETIDQAVGTTIKLWGRPFRVVGVMPAGFSYPDPVAVWIPVDTLFPGVDNRGAHNYRVLGRLRPGVSIRQAQAEMDGIAANLARRYPETNTNKGAKLVPLQEHLVGMYRSTLWILLGAVGLVLLIASVNIANLLLARGIRRVRQIAVQSALGASIGRIARHQLTETLVLALLGGALGVLAAYWGLDALLALAPAGIPRLDQVAIDRGALGFALLISLTVCLFTGLFPILQARGTDVVSALRAGARSVTGTHGRLRSALVVTQLAISLVLLTGAGLLLRSFQHLTALDPGFRPQDLLVVTGSYPSATRDEGARSVTFFDQLARQAQSLPGVAGAAFGGALPTEPAGSNGTYNIDGRPDLPPGHASGRNALWRVVGPDYFTAIGIRVAAGREIGDRDTARAPFVVVINESMARAAWPDESPLGRRIRIGWDSDEWMTIVGVVADSRQGSPETPVGQELFVPAAQHPAVTTTMKVVARTQVPPLTLTDELQGIGRALNPEVPLKFTTAQILVDETLSTPRFRALLIGLFAVVALLLSLVGVAGVMACVVAERRNEIGLRMAIGARGTDILRHFLLRALRLALLGLGFGLAASVAVAQLLRGLLYGVTASDPSVLALVSFLLVAAAVGAAAWPALRAARVVTHDSPEGRIIDSNLFAPPVVYWGAHEAGGRKPVGTRAGFRADGARGSRPGTGAGAAGAAGGSGGVRVAVPPAPAAPVRAVLAAGQRRHRRRGTGAGDVRAGVGEPGGVSGRGRVLLLAVPPGGEPGAG